MSTTTAIPREVRRSGVLTATEGQTQFGPFLFRVFDADDVQVEVRDPTVASPVWETATGVTVTLTESASIYSLFTITLATGMTGGHELRVFGRRLHSRLSDVTKGGALNGPALERELDKQAVVLSEVRTDIDLIVDPANRAEFKGDPGQDGADGADGADGVDGVDGQDGAGLRVDAAGLKADRSTHDAEPKPFGYLATDTNEISVKVSDASGDWSAWASLGTAGALVASNNLSDVNDAATARTNLGVDAAIQAAIDALLDGAPGALDTLNELAAAVDDDASFAASVTTALAGKVGTARAVNTGSGLSGGGDLSADRTIEIDRPSVAEVRNKTASKPVDMGRVEEAMAPVTLTFAASMTLDLDVGVVFDLTLTDNGTLTDVSNVPVGMSGVIIVRQDATGSRTLSTGANILTPGGAAIELSTDASAVDVLSWFGLSSTQILLQPAGKGFA